MSRFVDIKLLILFGVLITGLWGCGSPPTSDSTTSVTLTFNVPVSSKAGLQPFAPVPAGVASIKLEVTAIDMDKITDTFDVNPGETATRMVEIPSGPDRIFTATAYDAPTANGNALYQGQSDPVDLEPDVLTPVIIDMQAVLAAIAVTPINPMIVLGTTQPFTATGTFTDGGTQDLTTSVDWTSSDETVASIDSNGLATSLSEGPTTIMATDPTTGLSDSTTLTVTMVDVTGPILQADLTGVGAGAWQCGGGDTSVGASQDAGIVGTICNALGNIATIVIGPNEELSEASAETVVNYTISNVATGTATISTAVYSADVDGTATNEAAVTLTLSTPLTPAQVAATVVRTGANGLLQTLLVGDDITHVAAPNAGILTDITMTGDFGLCVDFGADGLADTAVTSDDELSVLFPGITTGPDGVCDSTANDTPAGIADDIQVVAVESRSGVCGIEIGGVGGGGDVVEAGTDEDTTAGAGGGLILTGMNGICETTNAAYMAAGGIQLLLQGTSTPNSAGLSPGPDGDLDSLLLNSAAICAAVQCDDALDGTRLTVTGVTDVNGNTIRTTGDEFFSDGSVR